jgi:hypothetical protein
MEGGGWCTEESRRRREMERGSRDRGGYHMTGSEGGGREAKRRMKRRAEQSRVPEHLQEEK